MSLALLVRVFVIVDEGLCSGRQLLRRMAPPKQQPVRVTPRSLNDANQHVLWHALTTSQNIFQTLGPFLTYMRREGGRGHAIH